MHIGTRRQDVIENTCRGVEKEEGVTEPGCYEQYIHLFLAGITTLIGVEIRSRNSLSIFAVSTTLPDSWACCLPISIYRCQASPSLSGSSRGDLEQTHTLMKVSVLSIAYWTLKCQIASAGRKMNDVEKYTTHHSR